MATEVTQIDFGKLENELEIQELDSPGGVASAQVYGQLLALYLLNNDVCNSKVLWKRIPHAVKNTTPELSTLWIVGQKMWQRDFPAIYESLKKDWSEGIKPIMAAVLDKTRKRAFSTVAQAYSSITADEFAAFMGLPVNEAVQGALAEGWSADPQSRFITPKKAPPPPDPVLPSEQHLSVLTDYVSVLEV